MFNGGSSYVDVGNVGGYPSGFTVSFWMRPQSFSGAEMSVIEKRGAAAGWAIGIPSSNALIWRTFAVGPSQFSFSTPSPAVKYWTWYYVTIVQNSGTAVIYENGALLINSSITNPGVDTTTLRFGNPNGGAIWFNGSIANVQIYNTTLDANTIKALYLGGIGGLPVNLQSLVGWWPLNGNANDYSGNLNNGQPTAVTYTSQWSNGYTVP